MLIMFKVVVAAAGTPGPLLGDGTNTTVTLLLPSTLTEANDTLGSRQSVINQTTRKHYAASRLALYGLRANTDDVLYGAQGVAAANMIPLAAAQGSPQMGSGLTENVDLGDIDIDATASGEGFLVLVEVL